MTAPNKFHTARLKSIAKRISDAQADKKKLEAMITKMEKSITKLSDNVNTLDEKIDKYKMLYVNVENDPDFKAL